MDEKLILTVSEHRQFGWKLNLHFAEVRTGGSLYILGVPNIKQEIEKGTSDDLIALMNAVNEISDESLLKAYSKEKNKAKIPQSTIDNLIRPRIEKNCAKILALAEKANLPIFFREVAGNKTIYAHNWLELLPQWSRCLFNFIKDKNGLRYFITLTNGEEEISLQQKPAIVVSAEPCVMLLGKQIHRVENMDAKKLIPFFTKTHIDVPAASEKYYIRQFVIKTIPIFEVRIEGIEMYEKPARRQAILVLEEDLYARLVFSLYFQYDNQLLIPTMNPRKKKVVLLDESNETIAWFNRDLEAEALLIEKLLELGLVKNGENHFYLQHDPEMIRKYGLIDWMNLNAGELRDFVIEQKTAQRFYQGAVRLQSNLDVKIDWFDLNVEVVFDDFKLPFSRFRKHILTGNPEFVLPDGSIFILPEEWFVQYHDLFLHAENTEQGVRLKKVHFSILPSSIEFFSEEDYTNKLEQFQQTLQKYPIPSEYLEQILRPYQKEGFYWLEHLRQMDFGGCLADDMGLGKTIQTITLFESIYAPTITQSLLLENFSSGPQLSLFDSPKPAATPRVPASLVVAPTSLLHNWQNELKKFAPDLRIYIYAGAKRLKSKEIIRVLRHYHVVITSYGMVRSDIEYLKEYPFHYVVLDESQYIKNSDSIIYKSVQQLSAAHRLVLTGTPIENSLFDLWAQFNFINPGLLGTQSFFKNQYVVKITKEKNLQAEASLLKLIKPFLLRRTKEEVTPELPLLSQEIVYCDMTEEQEKIYLAEKNRIRNQLLENRDLFVKNNLVALQSLMRLRLLSNHPSLVYPDYSGDSGKFDQILLYFETIRANGHKVLIFSSFVKHLKLLAKIFDEKEWKYAMLTGQTVRREEQIDRFKHDLDVNCFFISLKAGGTGLNLTEADYVFILDPWWNPAVEMQALSRAHRIGQDKNVMVYRFISNDSIEEKIIRLQMVKTELSETFVQSNNPLEQLNREEIEELFY
ncbi:MAG: DEAD/DEAH box helicase [Dysgonamonadaceae bacterium]|jgi:SNF2 family DNA or RNA helicase|nr:DEAD/DEAH box helicase [Dysgonamonadaceae bacterium]